MLQPKRLALLAYLALSADDTYCRRDLLLALFWPERSHTAARHALRHALYHLRNVLGDGVLVSRGSEEVGRARPVWSDVRAFEHALWHGRPSEALALYRGDFFAGVFADGVSADWEEWVSRTRARLRAGAAAAAWSVAELAFQSGDLARGFDTARRAQELDPDNEVGVQRLMRWLEQFGRRPAALQVFQEFTRRIRSEYRAEPLPGTSALADAIRAAASPRPGTVPAGAVPRRRGRWPVQHTAAATWRLRTVAWRRNGHGTWQAANGVTAWPVFDPTFDTSPPR